jgi:hypothetical protein
VTDQCPIAVLGFGTLPPGFCEQLLLRGRQAGIQALLQVLPLCGAVDLLTGQGLDRNVVSDAQLRDGIGPIVVQDANGSLEVV